MNKNLIEVKKLNKQFKNNNSTIKVLKNINLNLESGKLIALTGPSGAGKSTMLRALNGLVPLSTGSISTKVHGHLSDKKSWRLHQRRTAMIFQQHQLIKRQSALHNVLLGRIP